MSQIPQPENQPTWPAPPPPPPYGAYPPPGAAPVPVPGAYPTYDAYGRPVAQSSGLYKAAAIINWVVMGLLCLTILGIIACAWFIPMTIAIQKASKDRYHHTGLAVCTLLFCNIISGILMLVDNGNRQPRPLS